MASEAPPPRPESPASQQWDTCSAAGSETFSVAASDYSCPTRKEISSEWTSTASVGESERSRAVELSEEQDAFVRELLGEKSLSNHDSIGSISIACTQAAHKAFTESHKAMWQVIQHLEEQMQRKALEVTKLAEDLRTAKQDIETAEEELGTKEEEIVALQHHVEELEVAHVSQQEATDAKVKSLRNELDTAVRSLRNESDAEVKSLRNALGAFQTAFHTQEINWDKLSGGLQERMETFEKHQDAEIKSLRKRLADPLTQALSQYTRLLHSTDQKLENKIADLARDVQETVTVSDLAYDTQVRLNDLCNYVATVEKRILDNGQRNEVYDRDLAKLQGCCNMNADLVVHVQETVNKLGQEVEHIHSNMSESTLVDKNISRAMTEDLVNRLDTITKQIQAEKDIKQAQDKGLAMRVYGMEQRLLTFADKLRTVSNQFTNLKPCDSKHDTKALEEEYKELYDILVRDREAMCYLKSRLDSVEKKTENHSDAIRANLISRVRISLHCRRRFDDMIKSPKIKLGDFQTRMDCYEKLNRIVGLRSQVPVLTPTALMKILKDPLKAKATAIAGACREPDKIVVGKKTGTSKSTDHTPTKDLFNGKYLKPKKYTELLRSLPADVKLIFSLADAGIDAGPTIHSLSSEHRKIWENISWVYRRMVFSSLPSYVKSFTSGNGKQDVFTSPTLPNGVKTTKFTWLDKEHRWGMSPSFHLTKIITNISSHSKRGPSVGVRFQRNRDSSQTRCNSIQIQDGRRKAIARSHQRFAPPL